MAYKTLIIEHSKISEEILNDICLLKTVRWNYSIQQHKEWVEKNILPNDIHLIITEDNKFVAYTSLVNIDVDINNSINNFKGIGSVCTLVSGKGLGNILMSNVNQFLLDNNYKGLLLCKDELVQYYNKFSWELVDKKMIESDNFFNINFMTFNFNEKIDLLKYNGRNF